MPRRSSRESFPTMSGCSRLMCSSALRINSSSYAPRTTNPHSQLMTFAISPPSVGSLRRWYLDAELRKYFLGGLLFGALLRVARPRSELLAVDDRGAREPAVVRRAFHFEDAVTHRLAATGERLLQLGLLVDVTRQRVVDPGHERLHDRPLDLLEAVF